jgi:uncharacterized membrane protein YciS (DUF1049 family)
LGVQLCLQGPFRVASVVLAVVLAIGAALGWGIADFLGGLKSRSVPILSVLTS